MLYYSMPALAAGFILDLMIGDPRWLYHPVCLMAVSSGMSDRKPDRISGKNTSEYFSENR